jgi:dTDP-4-amino-4,6-dideoxygalactose transaminase
MDTDLTGLASTPTDWATCTFGMRTAIGFARASAGLHAFLSSIAASDGPGEVVIPALCCESVALAVVYAGHTPRFAEVSPVTLCANADTIRPLLTSRTRAVIVVHLYGIDARVEELAELRKAHPKVVFVEDVAHALGGKDRHGKLLGGALDCTLLSFAPDKIVRGDGGMLLFRDARTLRVHGRAAPTSQRLATSLRNLVHGLADLWRECPEANTATAFERVVPDYRDLIVRDGGIHQPATLRDDLGRLEEIRTSRYANYVRYRDGIRTAVAVVPDLHEGSTCWRCPVLFDTPSLADRVTAALRTDGIHASNHYFPLNLLFGSLRLPASERIARRVVNLWVNEDATSDAIERTIRIINGI